MSSKAGPSKRRDESPLQDPEDFEPSLETQFVPQPGDSQAMFEALEILDEKGSKYLIRWAGEDPSTGLPYKPTWEGKNGATPLLVQEWKRAKRQNPSIVGQSAKKRKQRAGTGTASPKRTRRDESTTTETRVRTSKSKTPASNRQGSPSKTPKSTRPKEVKQEDQDSSYQPTLDDQSKASEVFSEDERSVSPVKSTGKRRPRASILEVEIPTRRKSTPSSNGAHAMSSTEPSPDKGKRKAPIVIDDSNEDSAGNASIIPDSQSQSQSQSLPEADKHSPTIPKSGRSIPVPSVNPDVFRPFLPDQSRFADQTVIPSSADLPSQVETIHQFTSPVSKRGNRGGSNSEEENQPVQESEDDQDNSESSSPVNLIRVVAEDGTEMWIAADESQDERQEEEMDAVDVTNELDDQATIESVLLPETNGMVPEVDEAPAETAAEPEMDTTAALFETTPIAASEMREAATDGPTGSSTIREARAELELVEAQSTIERLTQERDSAIRAERVRAEEHDFALNLYNQASNKAVEAAESSKALSAQVKTLQEQLDLGLKQRELFNEAIAATKNKEVLQLRAQLKILLDQNRLTDDEVRERARRCDDAERRNSVLHEQLVHQTERNDLLRDRNNELARRYDLLLAEKTGALDDDEESNFESESEAEYSDGGLPRAKPPPQPTVANASNDIDMQDDDIDAAVAMASQPAEAEEGALPDSLSQSRQASAGPQSVPNFASANVDQWWACKWHDGAEGCPVLSRSRQELEEHARAHVRGTVDSQGANMVALS